MTGVDPTVAIGSIVGDYVYVKRPNESFAPFPYTREVEWLIKSVPLENFDEDLQKSFKNSQRNVVLRVSKLNSEARIERTIGAYLAGCKSYNAGLKTFTGL